MRLRDLYARPGVTLSVEFYPPKTDQGDEDLLREALILKSLHPFYCSMTYGAGGTTREKSVDLVTRIQRECALTTMCHLTVAGQSKAEVRGVLEKLKTNGIENIIALAGDPPQGAAAEWVPHPDGFHYSIGLVREAVAHGRFSIAVAGFPEVHPRAGSRVADLRYLKEKVDAGADVVITQLFFDNDDYYRYVDDARKLGVRVPIVPGLLPIQSVAQARRITALCGSKIPPRFEALLAAAGNDNEKALQLGIDYTTQQCEGLLRFGVPGIHFYSLNKSHSVKAVFENLSFPAAT
ncbi:MAG: methylenetetrahydrofolate reductase [Casimicrobiaceae bacterium]